LLNLSLEFGVEVKKATGHQQQVANLILKLYFYQTLKMRGHISISIYC